MSQIGELLRVVEATLTDKDRVSRPDAIGLRPQERRRHRVDDGLSRRSSDAYPRRTSATWRKLSFAPSAQSAVRAPSRHWSV